WIRHWRSSAGSGSHAARPGPRSPLARRPQCPRDGGAARAWRRRRRSSRRRRAMSPHTSASIRGVRDGTLEGIGIDLLFAAPPFTGLEVHALHILRGLALMDTPVDVFAQEDVVPMIAAEADGHRIVPFPRVPRALRLGREQWAIPWRFGPRPRSYRLVHSVIGVAPLLLKVPFVLTVPDLTYRV